MEKDEKKLLKVVQETDALSPPLDVTGVTTPAGTEKEIEKKEETKKPGFELPAGYLMAQEMKELFEEDIVTHVQGPSEPEGD